MRPFARPDAGIRAPTSDHLLRKLLLYLESVESALVALLRNELSTIPSAPVLAPQD